MNLKRAVLTIVTIISLLSVFLALSQSLSEPQVQAQLELYQTNLILNSAELSNNTNNQSDNNNLSSIGNSLVGTNPYLTAEKQYQKTLDLTESSISKLETQVKENDLTSTNNTPQTPRKLLKQNIQQNKNVSDDLKIKLGIIEAYQNKLEAARNVWQEVGNQTNLTTVLNDIWLENRVGNPNAEQLIDDRLEGWFKNVTLEKIYQINDDRLKLEQIVSIEQESAQKAIYQLLSLSFIPVIGGILGVGLIIFLLVQLLLKKEESILAVNASKLWESPWDGEIIWQVLIVGFFFLSQVVLPILIGASGFNPMGLGVRGKALYVLVSYILMAGGGLTVLYFSLKQYFPLPENWFKFTNKNWFFWGIGGYLTAIPIVFFVSFINQQIWQGKGGSNPLLLLTLQSQDKVAIAILFVTASIAAPIFEEILFRGFLLPSLTRYLPVSGAIIVSGIVFAIAHLSLAEIIPLATLGIILGIVYTRSRSLLASIMVHSLWNTGTLFTLFVLGS